MTSIAIDNKTLDLEPDKNDEKYLVPGLLRGLSILEAFNRNGSEMTITEIAEILDVNRSSAFRLIYTLESVGYLRKASPRTYALGSKVMELGHNALAKLSLLDISTPLMKQLRDTTKIAVHLSILEDTHIVFINNVQSLGSFTSNIQLGTRWPAHATAIGQILLSSLSDSEIEKRYRKFDAWQCQSKFAPKNCKELLKRIEYVRTQPAMISWGHFNHDMAACAAPIYKFASQEIKAVLSVSCPISSYDEEYFYSTISKQVVDTANKISEYIY